MGIKPTGGYAPAPIAQDTVQSRYGQWVTDLEGAGDQAGGVIAEVDSKASSSNEGVVELAAGLSAVEARVMALEGRVSALESVPPAHEHSQADVSGLVAAVEDIRRRLSALENPPA